MKNSSITTYLRKRADDNRTIVENPDDNRPVFANLHKLSVDIMNKNIDNVNVSILSMGMTNDYEVAIEEGATMVRVGTGIFGARNYQI